MIHVPKRDPHARWVRSVRERAGAEAALAQSTTRPWASATFVGAMHRLTLRLTGEDAMARAVALGERLVGQDYAIPGHIVADVAVDGYIAATAADGQEAADIRMAALTVEDW